jgi:hypothetical protein
VDVQGDEIGQRVRRLGGEVEFGRFAEPDLLNRKLLPKVARLGILIALARLAANTSAAIDTLHSCFSAAL